MGNTCECVQRTDKNGKVQSGGQTNIIDIRSSQKNSIQKKKGKKKVSSIKIKTEMDFDEVTASPALNHRDKLDLTLEQKTQEERTESYKRYTPSMNIVNPGHKSSNAEREEQQTITIEIKKEMVDNLFDQMLQKGDEKLRKTDSSRGGPVFGGGADASYNDTLQKALDRHFVDAGTPYANLEDDLFDKISQARHKIDELFRNTNSVILKTNKKNSVKTLNNPTSKGSLMEPDRPHDGFDQSQIDAQDLRNLINFAISQPLGPPADGLDNTVVRELGDDNETQIRIHYNHSTNIKRRNPLDDLSDDEDADNVQRNSETMMMKKDKKSEDGDDDQMDFGIIQRDDDPEETPSFYIKRASNADLSNLYEEKRKSKRMQREVSVYNQDDSVLKQRVVEQDITTQGNRVLVDISASGSDDGGSPKNRKNITCYQMIDTNDNISKSQIKGLKVDKSEEKKQNVDVDDDEELNLVGQNIFSNTFRLELQDGDNELDQEERETIIMRAMLTSGGEDL